MNASTKSTNADMSHGHAGHWENYWAQAHEDGRDAAVTGAARSKPFQDAWRLFFQSVEANSESGLRLADLACGAGVVSEIAAKAFTSDRLKASSFIGLDYSSSAARQYGARFNDSSVGVATGVVGDALDTPLKPHSIDAVVSQFGLEYAGADALVAAGTLTAPGGRLMCLVHHKNGSIEKECRENLNAAEAIFATKAIAKTHGHFARPNDSIALLEMRAAMDKLRKAVEALPESAGKRLASQLRLDLTRLIARRAAFNTGEVVKWFDANTAEISLYADRMRSMINAALDQSAVEDVCRQWRAEGLDIEPPESLYQEGALSPSAWRLVASRPGS